MITEENFTLFAAKIYDNPNCVDMDEFNEDLNRIKYIKKLMKKYETTGELRTRLIMNHLIVLYNTFSPPQECSKMMIFKLREYLPTLLPFLTILNFIPEKPNININDSDSDIIEFYKLDIEHDNNVVNEIKKELSR